MTEAKTEEAMTADEKAGMEWWNSLTPIARSYWLSTAGSAVAADAWKAFKQEQAKTAVYQERSQNP